MWVQSLGQEEATHSRILAWRIPQTEEPGRLQSLGSLRVIKYFLVFLLVCTYSCGNIKSALNLETGDLNFNPESDTN